MVPHQHITHEKENQMSAFNIYTHKAKTVIKVYVLEHMNVHTNCAVVLKFNNN
jgi:hypothetical protein